MVGLNFVGLAIDQFPADVKLGLTDGEEMRPESTHFVLGNVSENVLQTAS